MRHLGDITKINGYEVPIVDCVIGGSPCQDLSMAGKREGLNGARSGLFMEQIRIIREMRENDRKSGTDGAIRPRYMVWENVPGALSSNGGEDFRVVLEETARIADQNAVIPRPEKWRTSGCIMADGWSIAWRILDAQFWGVPQRRRRIALIADFGGESAPEILFVRKGVCGDYEKGRGKGETTAAEAERGVAANDSERLAALTMRMQQGCEGGGKGPLIQAELSGTLTRNNDQVIFQPTAYGICSKDSNAMRSANPHSGIYEAETARTLDTNGGNPSCNQGGIVVVACHPTPKIDTGGLTFTLSARDYKNPQAVCYATQSYSEIKESETAASLKAAGGTYGGGSETLVCENHGTDAHYTLNTIDRPAVCAGFSANIGAKAKGIGYREEQAPTLSAQRHDASVVYPIVGEGVCGTLDAHYAKMPGMRGGMERTMVVQEVCKDPSAVEGDSMNVVRRLTPLECERLQGYPDGWTDIGDYIDSNGKKRKTSDSARYKALGNSIALPPWKWVLKRLCACYERDATMASLFDGIGGFPLIWEQLNGKGTCLWTSEIEEFPMAVTKRRFGG